MKIVYRIAQYILDSYTEVMNVEDNISPLYNMDNRFTESIVRITQNGKYLVTIYYFMTYESV